MRIWKTSEKMLKQMINIIRDEDFKATPLHTHEFMEIEYILSGTGVQTVNGIDYTVQRGDLLFLRKGDCHTYYSTDKLRLINVIFYYSVFDEMWTVLRSYFPEEVMNFPTVMHLNRAEFMEIESLLLRAEREFVEEKTGYYTILKSCLIELLIHMGRLVSGKEQQHDNKIITAILNYVDENYAHLSLVEIAQRFGYSSTYFSKLFKKHVGISFTEYINQKRVNRAAELLLGTNKTIEAICQDIGLSDKKHFYTLFYRQIGCTPAEFRKA